MTEDTEELLSYVLFLDLGEGQAFTLYVLYIFYQRRKWQPTLVFLPGESHGKKNLKGYSPWGRKELGMTEATQHVSTPFINVYKNQTKEKKKAKY